MIYLVLSLGIGFSSFALDWALVAMGMPPWMARDIAMMFIGGATAHVVHLAMDVEDENVLPKD